MSLESAEFMGRPEVRGDFFEEPRSTIDPALVSAADNSMRREMLDGLLRLVTRPGEGARTSARLSTSTSTKLEPAGERAMAISSLGSFLPTEPGQREEAIDLTIQFFEWRDTDHRTPHIPSSRDS